MKKALTVVSFTLGLSIVAGSAFAASNDMWASSPSVEETNEDNQQVADLTTSTAASE